VHIASVLNLVNWFSNESSNARRLKTTVSYTIMKNIWLLLIISMYSFSQTVEDFYSFFSRFSVDSVFQKERVVFPLKVEIQTINMIRNYNLEKENYEYRKLIELNYFTNFQNSFNDKMIDSNEKVFEQIGNENGIHIKYYFKRINGLWFLVEYKDLST